MRLSRVVPTPRRVGCAPRRGRAQRPTRDGRRAGGTAFGGLTAQHFPVVIDTNKNGRKVAKATIAIRPTCTSGAIATTPDRYTALTVTKKRKFQASFGPATTRNPDGTTTDVEGSISGRTQQGPHDGLWEVVFEGDRVRRVRRSHLQVRFGERELEAKQSRPAQEDRGYGTPTVAGAH